MTDQRSCLSVSHSGVPLKLRKSEGSYNPQLCSEAKPQSPNDFDVYYEVFVCRNAVNFDLLLFIETNSTVNLIYTLKKSGRSDDLFDSVILRSMYLTAAVK